MNKKLKIAITGDRGFVGSYLKQLIKLTTKPEEVEVQGWDTKTMHVQDIRLFDTQEAIGEWADVVIHLAALSGVAACEDPKYAESVNQEATLSLAKECHKRNVKRFIFASSSAVYGETDEFYIKEDQTCYPLNTYGKTKLQAEKIINFADTNFDVVILRKSNLYGYGMYYKGIIAIDRFIEAYLQQTPMTIRGTGTQKRDFLHLGDCVRLYRHIALTPMVRSGIYNVGGGECVSILELANMVNEIGEKLYGWRTKIECKGEGERAWHDFHYDFSRARMEFQFDPYFSLDQYITERMMMGVRRVP